MSTFKTRDIVITISMHCRGDYSKMIEVLKTKKKLEDAEIASVYSHFKKGCRALTILDDDYPAFFKSVDNPPLVLYYYGDLSLLKAEERLSVVGTRTPKLSQSSNVYRLIKELEISKKNRVVICSGLAKGIDYSSMQACLDTSSPLIGVLGCGIDYVYPTVSAKFYDYCKSGKGLLISEYPEDVAPKPSNFVFRNRLTVAMSKALLVGGGQLKSGTATSVKIASDMGRDVLAIPTDISEDSIDLANSVLRDGAYPILTSRDLEEFIKCDR